MESIHRQVPHVSGSGVGAYISGLWDPALSWDDFEWIRQQTSLPVGVKGVLAPQDADLACRHGAAVVVVSNHGGRQLDHSIATLAALPGVVEAVDGRSPVLLDGGVRRGTDVIKALALGARAVMMGRPYVWGLAHGGQAGVRQVLELLSAELRLDMALCGCGRLEDVGRELIAEAC
jgi:isopentenyl diphosphate isomerase/L-lactate dehydrogenase-like FMN-dependent dehydrogenase